MLHASVVIPLLWLVAVASVDAHSRRIPNTLLLTGLLLLAGLFVVGRGVLPWGVRLSDGCMAAVVGFIFLLPFYGLRWMGAGDVKLAAVLGLGMGLQPVFWVWLVASLLAGLHSLLIVFVRPTAWWPAAKVWLTGKDGEARRKPVPYGSYLAVAAALVGSQYTF